MEYTPLLVAAHSPTASVFSSGSPASGSLQAMAEGGEGQGVERRGNAAAAVVDDPLAIEGPDALDRCKEITGAIVQRQPFGGWKGSGSTGKSALGPYYVGLFVREQSHTIVD